MFNTCNNLYDFIREYDIEAVKDPDNIELKVLFAKIVVKLGLTIQHSKSGLVQMQELTLLSAKEFLVKSTDENWEAFCQSSTNSYPFGPGDGCYCVEKTGFSECKQGSGCISGIGSLVFCELPQSIVWSIIREAIAE